MLSLLLYLLVMGATLYVAAIYSSGGMVFVLGMEFIYLLLALLWLVYQRRHLNVRLELPMPAAEKNQEVPLELVTENTGRLPTVKETVVLRYKSFGGKRTEKLSLQVFSRGRGIQRFTGRLMSRNSGSYYFEQAVLIVWDPLRLLRIKKRLPLHERLDIMPELYSTGILVSEAVRHFMGESDVYDSLHGGEDPSELFQIRDFRAGDKVKDIHWKLSAKEEKWVVRENSNPRACGVVLLVDLFVDRKVETDNLDALLSLAASISFSLVEKSCPHYVAWFSYAQQDFVRVRVDDEESLYLFLMNIFGESGAKTQQSLRDAYRERYKGESFLTDISVNSSLQVFLRGELVKTCRRTHLEEDLSELLLKV